MRSSLAGRTVSVCALTVLLSCDSGTGNDGSFAISLSQSAISVGQGTNAAVTVDVTRSDFDKPITLTVSGLPAGVTGAFTPASVTSGTTSSALLLTANGTTAPGTSTLTIHATGEGAEEQSASLDLTITVTGSFSLSPQASTVTVAQSGATNTTLLVNRVGGFAGIVSIGVSGTSPGLTATLTPTNVSGSGASLAISASGAVAPGTYNLVVTGTSPGLSDQTTQIPVTVIAPPATSSLTITFCTGGLPLWLAYQNEGSAWQQLSPSGTSFTFAATNTLGVAYVTPAPVGTQMNIYYMTRAELAAIDGRDCQGSKTLSGSVAGLSAGQSARVVMGAVAASPNPTSSSPAFSMQNVATRPLDLIATRGVVSGGELLTPDRIIIRRAQDFPTGTTMPVLDFSQAESFAPVSSALTINGLQPGEALFLANTYWSATSSFGSIHSAEPSTGSVTLFSVPDAQIAAGDRHELFVTAEQFNGTAGHSLVSWFTTPTDRIETLGPYLGSPTASVVGVSPYVRFRGVQAVQTEYAGAVAFGFFQQTSQTDARYVVVVTSSGYLGGTPTTNWDVVIPDFGTVAGFSNNWMHTQGQNTGFLVEAYSGRPELLFGAVPTTGETLRLAFRITGTSSIVAGGSRQFRAMGPVRGAQYFRR